MFQYVLKFRGIGFLPQMSSLFKIAFFFPLEWDTIIQDYRRELNYCYGLIRREISNVKSYNHFMDSGSHTPTTNYTHKQTSCQWAHMLEMPPTPSPAAGSLQFTIKSEAAVLTQGDSAPPSNIWQCLGTFSLVTLRKYYWHLEDKGQRGCHQPARHNKESPGPKCQLCQRRGTLS